MVRRLTLSDEPFPSFQVLVATRAGKDELYVEVDHYRIPEESDERNVICVGLGGLDAKEFAYEVDKLISQLQRLKVLAKKHFEPGA